MPPHFPGSIRKVRLLHIRAAATSRRQQHPGVMPVHIPHNGAVMPNKVTHSPVVVIIGGGKEKRPLSPPPQRRVPRIKTVYNAFQLRRHSKIVERRHENDHFRLFQDRKQFLHPIVMDTAPLCPAMLTGQTGGYFFFCRIKTKNVVSRLPRPFDKSIGEGSRCSVPVRASGNDDYMHVRLLLYIF